MPDDLVSRLLESEEGKAAIAAADRAWIETGRASDAFVALLRSLASTERGRGWLAALAFPGEQIEALIETIDTAHKRLGHEPRNDGPRATLSAAMEVRGG